MKKIVLSALLSILFIVGYSQTNHTITIDGTINTSSGENWSTSNERFSTSTGSSVYGYITWDANYIYVAWPQVDFDGYNQACYIVIDTDPSSNNGTTNLGYEQWFRGSTVNAPFNADLIFMIKEYNSSLEEHVYQYYSGNWEKDGANGSTDYRSSFDHAYGNASGNNKDIEFRINKNDIGLTNGNPFKIIAYCKNLDNNNGWGYLHRAIPHDGTSDGENDKTISHYLGYLTTNNVAPNNPSYEDINIYRWNGSTDNDWGTSANWSGNTVPSSSDLVVISSGNTVISEDVSSPAQSYDIVINGTGSLTINVNKALTVSGNFTNNLTADKVYIDSDINGNGSIIVNGNVSGEMTIKRYIAKFSGDNDGWHEIGCPVASFNVANTDWDPTHTGTNNDLYYYDEATDQWINYRTSTFNFEGGKGYLVANDDDINHSFTGTINNSDVTFTNLSYNTSKGNGWHLLGNPYPSAILWNNNSDWTFTNVGSVCSVWDENGGSYVSPANGDPIPSTNGFFVQVDNATNTLKIPASARSHNSHANYKSSGSKSSNTLNVKVLSIDNGKYNLIRVAFNSEATEAWDIKYDAHKLYGMDIAPDLWTLSNNEEFAVNTLPFNNEPVDLPLNFKPGINGNYQLEFSNIESFGENSNIILEDLFTGNSIDIKQNQVYTFSAEKEDSPNRFILHFYNVTSTPEIEKGQSTLIYAYNNSIILKSSKELLNGNVEVINLLGQVVYEQPVSGTGFVSLHPQLENGVYIVRYQADDGFVQSEKVILQ